MNSRKQIRNREIQQKRIQTRERKHKTSRTNHTKKTLNSKRRNKRNLLNYKIELGRHPENRLNRSDKMRNE